MCLSIAVEHPDKVLETGVQFGYEWAITHNNGYRCGYVRIPQEHPLYGKDCHDDEVWELNIHGGITFGEADKPCEKEGEDNAWWLGFDCAHAGDAADPDLPGSSHNEIKIQLERPSDSIKTTDYVRKECFSLVEQLKRMPIAQIELNI